MQPFLYKVFSFFMGFISASNIKRILLNLKWYWQKADTLGKIMIMVFFLPSLAVLFWMLFDITYVVVFTLPGIIIKIFAQIFLFCIFWCAAVYLYEKLHGIMSNKTGESEQTNKTQDSEKENDVRSKWRGKDSI